MAPTLLQLAILALGPSAEAAESRIVGATETVTVEESGLSFLGRMDTGAATTSIHAVDIEVDGQPPEGADQDVWEQRGAHTLFQG